MSELRQVPGFVGAQLNRRPLDDKIEFLVLTRWQSMDAIRVFAGTDAEKAVVLSAIVCPSSVSSALHRRNPRIPIPHHFFAPTISKHPDELRLDCVKTRA